jgi:superfamily I DNA and RNA helicase
MQFHPYEPFDNNSAQRKVWNYLKDAFKDDPGVAYYRYPIFTKSGNLHREPDVLMLHRELGLWVIECKGCSISSISSIQGHNWEMLNWHREHETPVGQAEDQMFALKSKFEQHRETRGLLSFYFRVALPHIKQRDWEIRGFADLPSTQGVVMLAEHLTPAALRNKLIEGAKSHPQRPLTDEQWEFALTVLGGTLPAKEPRPIPTGTPPDNPVRVIQAVEAQIKKLDGPPKEVASQVPNGLQQIKKLDEKQQKVAFEVPNGPQRIRGLAGTGKTVLLAKRVAKMHAAHPDWRIAFVFFTRSLYDQVLELIGLYYREMTDGGEPNWHQINVLHAWGAREHNGFYRNLAQKSGQKPLSVKDVEQAKGTRVSPAEAFEYACDRLEQDVPRPPILYDAIVIDEGQDLPPSFYRLAYNTLSEPKRLYWAYDEAQGIGSLIVPEPEKIFGRNSDGTRVVDLKGIYPGGIKKAHRLNRCYRTPKQLLMAANAINMGLFRQGGALQGVTTKENWSYLGYKVVNGDFTAESVKARRTVTIERDPEYSPHPIDQSDFAFQDALGSVLMTQTFSSESAEQEWIAKQVAKDLALGFDPWDLLITCLNGNYPDQYFEGLRTALKKKGVQSVIAGEDTGKDIFRMHGCVTISNIARAKGNEAYKVYACRFQYAIQPLAWRHEEELHKRNEAFVALTRAKIWCVVTGLESPVFEELRKAQEHYPALIFPAFNQNTLRRRTDDTEDEEEQPPVPVKPAKPVKRVEIPNLDDTPF